MLIQAADAKPTNDAAFVTYGDESLRDADTVKLEFDLFSKSGCWEAGTRAAAEGRAGIQWQKRP